MYWSRFIFPVQGRVNRDQTRARARTRRIDREREGAHASSALCPPPPPIPPPLAPLSSPTVIYTLTFKHTRLDLSACKWATFDHEWILGSDRSTHSLSLSLSLRPLLSPIDSVPNANSVSRVLRRQLSRYFPPRVFINTLCVYKFSMTFSR